jgi:hypothetical protein
LTDSIHDFHPVIPALLAWIILLMPRIGVLTWKEFERNIDLTQVNRRPLQTGFFYKECVVS